MIPLCVEEDATGPAHPPRAEIAPVVEFAPDGSLVAAATGSLAGLTDKMWDVGSTLRVYLGGGSAYVRSKVREHAMTWTEHANIHVEWVDDWRVADVRATFRLGEGSHSTVGRDARLVPFGLPTMNFGWFTDDTPDEEFRRTATHEFGHALGLVHEHQSPAGGIAWDRPAVYARFRESNGWDAAKVDHNVFDRYSAATTNFTAFDPVSIMAYEVPAELTLDGRGVAGGVELSATDKEWIGRWYPFPPSRKNAQGTLRTGDDCDEIDFEVQYDRVPADVVHIEFGARPPVDWWKKLEIPIGGGGYGEVTSDRGSSWTWEAPFADLDASRPLRFWKAKGLGARVKLDYTWDAIPGLTGGCRVVLGWKRDRC